MKPSHSIRVVNLSKRFGGVRIFDSLTFGIGGGGPGKIAGILGPNGVGKTTLYRLLTGRVRPDAGRIEIDGREVARLSSDCIARLGVHLLFQETRLFPRLAPREHLALGRMGGRSLVRTFMEDLLTMGRRHESPGGPGDPHAPPPLFHTAAASVASLSLGFRRALQIDMSLCGEPAILLLDEPSAGLDRTRIGELSSVLRVLRERGNLVLIAEHRPEIVWDLCDEVHVFLPLVHGCRSQILSGPAQEIRSHPVVRQAYLGDMSGMGRTSTPSGEARLSLRGLCAGYEDLPEPVLVDAHLEVRAGEIVGLVGPNGAGKSTLLRAVVGEARRLSGTIEITGVPCPQVSPRELIQMGVAYVPEGRGIFGQLSVQDNLEVGYFPPPLRPAQAAASVLELFPDLAARRRQRAMTLSGGERHRLALARALARNPRILLLDEPARGLSPQAARTVFEDLRRRCEISGTAVLVAEHSPILLDAAHRIYTMEEGRLGGELHAGELEDLRERALGRRS